MVPIIFIFYDKIVLKQSGYFMGRTLPEG